jgi:alkylation response protein AidB-like acyl-CoA dehydrogenase
VNAIRHDPGWEAVSREVYRRGIVGLNYATPPAPFLVTFAMGYLLSQADVSLHCPATMTGAVAYVLDRHGPAALRRDWLPALVRTDGEALTGGTWATELSGGSDVGGTTTVAVPRGDHVELSGLKWFASNADGGLALATARPNGAGPGTRGLGLYLVPLHRPDGSPNALRIRRLKDKLGTVGVPTGEIDLMECWALEVAPPPDGFRLMMLALEFSRLHNAMASAGLQRRAFAEALAYAEARAAFGRPLTVYPMIQEQLARMLVQLEASLALAVEAAALFDAADRSRADAAGRAGLRLATALAKYHTAEEANVACRAAIEIIGGNGYTYDYVTPRLLRDAQVMTVWEGPANIQALEMLRLLGDRHPGFAAFERRVEGILGAAPAALDDIADAVRQALSDCRDAVALVRGDESEAQRHARRLLALLADLLAAALLLEEAAATAAEGDWRKAVLARLFVAERLRPPPGRGLVAGASLVERHFAALAHGGPVAVNDRL